MELDSKVGNGRTWAEMGADLVEKTGRSPEDVGRDLIEAMTPEEREEATIELIAGPVSGGILEERLQGRLDAEQGLRKSLYYELQQIAQLRR